MKAAKLADRTEMGKFFTSNKYDPFFMICHSSPNLSGSIQDLLANNCAHFLSLKNIAILIGRPGLVGRADWMSIGALKIWRLQSNFLYFWNNIIFKYLKKFQEISWPKFHRNIFIWWNFNERKNINIISTLRFSMMFSKSGPLSKSPFLCFYSF